MLQMMARLGVVERAAAAERRLLDFPGGESHVQVVDKISLQMSFKLIDIIFCIGCQGLKCQKPRGERQRTVLSYMPYQRGIS